MCKALNQTASLRHCPRDKRETAHRATRNEARVKASWNIYRHIEDLSIIIGSFRMFET